jgi:uncharacterized protein YfbU (UPF0304 family)
MVIELRVLGGNHRRMKLTKVERLMLINQLKILEKLYPEEADYYAQHHTALAEGYTLHYSWLFETIFDDLPEEECREVLNVLDMYRAITRAVSSLDDGDSLKEHYLSRFRGFDGNEETKLMAYTRYFIIDLDRYRELRHEDDDDFNSHSHMLEKYRRMLQVWTTLPKKHELSRDDLDQILEAS